MGELGLAFREGGINQRDVQLAVEAPVDGSDLSEESRALISRSMMIGELSLESDLEAAFAESDGRSKYTTAVITALEASGIEIDGLSPTAWFERISFESERATEVRMILQSLQAQFSDLGLANGQVKVSDLIDTGIR